MSERKLKVALAGNANVGKSVIFNQLTGLHQHVGNWPGKTVERAEGTLFFGDIEIEVIDLPGIYSLSTYSIEELISREYIAVEQPDVIVNVVDASALERNLAFTVQLLELEPRMVVALNQIDVAESKGVIVYTEELSRLLGVPVVPTVAVKGAGLSELMERVVEAAGKREKAKPREYGPEIEEQVNSIASMIEAETPYPRRWIAVKLLEGDEEITAAVYGQQPDLRAEVDDAVATIEEIHSHDISSVIASERYALASAFAHESSSHVVPERGLQEALADATTHPVWGYLFMVASILTIFFVIFSFGDWLAGALDEAFTGVKMVYFNALGSGSAATFIWDAVIDGFIGGVVVALPYIGPFYLVLSVLEDSGYLARVAFLMDSAMHAIGLHGKGFIPVMLGFGCNVPAVLGARIMETERERLIAAFVTTLVPCAAVTAVVLGLVGAFVSVQWALALYVINLLAIFLLGRVAFKTLPGEPTALIMEMHDYRKPDLKTVTQQTWFRLREFIKIAFPLIIVGSLVIKLIQILNLIEPIATILSPITVTWLGLPAITGITLIFGVFRKELTLIMLATLLETTDFAQVLTPIQMIVFALVTMLYVPCVATIAALVREFGWKRALFIAAFETVFAIFIGGIAFRFLSFFRIL